MMSNTRKQILAVSFALLAILASALPVAAQSSHYVRIENNTGYDIYQVRLSSTRNPYWGGDRLGRDILGAGEYFTISAPNGSYDLQIVDEDGDVCAVHDVSIYSDQNWNLTPTWLLRCEFTR
jgi:hypothetical protein